MTAIPRPKRAPGAAPDAASRRGIMAGGNWIVDRVKIIDLYPAQDTLANILDQQISNGGCPYNVLVDLARMGADFPLEGVGLVGTDAEGGYIRDDCRRHNIDTAGLAATDKAPTSFTDVMTVKSTGRRTFFHQRGANAWLDDGHFDFTKTRAKMLHLGYLLLLDRLDMPHAEHGTVAAGVLRRASEAGLFTSVDIVSEDGDRFARIVRPAMPFCDCCIMNEYEAQRSTEIPLRAGNALLWENLPAAAGVIARWGPRHSVVIHFPEGAFARLADGAVAAQGSVAIPESLIAGASGAGDAFAAGLLFGLHNGLAMSDCLRDAVAAAAACMSHPSTSGGIPTLEKCRELARRHGFRPVPKSFSADG